MARNKTNARFKWLKPPGRIINELAVHDGRIATFAAMRWNQLYTPFVPMDSGFLAHDSVEIEKAEKGKLARIRHRASYARRIYNGRNLRFRTTKHIHATFEWDKAAERAGRKHQLVREVKAYARRLNKRR